MTTNSSSRHNCPGRMLSTRTALLFNFIVFLIHAARYAAALDMPNWMAALNGDTTRLLNIVLPGSHDAGAYKIYKPESGETVQTCGSVDLGGVPDFILNQLANRENADDGSRFNLVETQRVTIYDQLMLGIRYLDVRVGSHTDVNSETVLRLHHTLFMDTTLEDALTQIVSFMSTHATEVVVLKLKLQCGTPFDQVQALLLGAVNDNGDILYGGPLTPTVLSSSLSQIQGHAYVIWDEGDPETAQALADASNDGSSSSSVNPESYYRINPCKVDGTNGKKSWWGWWDDLMGGDTDNQCWSWSDYTYDQGQWLTDQIVQDLGSGDTTNNPLAQWQQTTSHEDSFRVLSFIGVLPMGNGCDPTNQVYLIAATLSCDRISINSYTATFQAQFGTLLEILQQHNMGAGVLNAIQVDFVDGYALEDMVVQLNQQFL